MFTHKWCGMEGLCIYQISGKGGGNLAPRDRQDGGGGGRACVCVCVCVRACALLYECSNRRPARPSAYDALYGVTADAAYVHSPGARGGPCWPSYALTA
jgi:hypothetical protein